MSYDDYLIDHETTVNNIRYDHDADIVYGTLSLVDAGADDWIVRLRKNGRYSLLKALRPNYSHGTGVLVSRQKLVRQGKIDLPSYRLREMREDDEALIATLKEIGTDVGRHVARDILSTSVLQIPGISIAEFLVDLFSCEPYLGSRIRLVGDTTEQWVQPLESSELDRALFSFATDVILRHRRTHDVPFRFLIAIPKPASAREQMATAQRRRALADAIVNVSWPDPNPIITILRESQPTA